MAYASIQEVQTRLKRTLTESELSAGTAMLEDAAIIIDAYNVNALPAQKNLVSIRMVMRALGDGQDSGIPMGATQASMSGLGYSQSWTMGSGTSNAEVYLSSLEKRLLGVGNRIGSHSPTEDLKNERLDDFFVRTDTVGN